MRSAPILVIDKVGIIGDPLSLKLSKEFPVVYAGNSPLANAPFSRKIPIIPDNKYSHIIVVDDGEGLEFLPKIIEKAISVNSHFIFVQELSLNEKYPVGKVLVMYRSSKVVLYGDIFDNRLIHEGENFKSVINKFLYQAQRFGKIQIIGEGLRETYPVLLADVVDRLIDLVFGLNKRHSLFYIFPKHPPTELSLAHMIQKANPEITIDFIKHDSKKGSVSFPPNGENLLGDKYQLTKKIRNLKIKKNEPAEKKKEIESPGKVKNLKSFPLVAIWILIFLLFSPLVFTLVFSFLGLNTLYVAKTQIDKGSFVNAKSSLHLSKTFFIVGKKTSDMLYFQGKFIGQESKLKRLMEDIDLGYRISDGILQAFSSEIYFSKIFTGKSKNPTDDFAKAQSYLKSSVYSLEKVKAEGDIPSVFSQKLEIIDLIIKLLSNTVDIMPGVFGMEGQRTYLMLFQNNMELRPSGGFIGSYGILKINMGKVSEFIISDVHDADGQLKGHVEPPFAIRRHLPSVHWYLRDSNFDVDFVKSASASSNLLLAETGQKVSGVIGVDTTFVKNILHAIGPVYVADYKESVNENNLYMLTQTYAQKNFLISLYKAIIAKISEGNIDYLSLTQALSDSLSEKHLIFAFNDNIQNIFTVNGWSSSLWDERIEDEKTINDFLGINEANLGVNKVNYFISRKVTHKVKAEDNGSITAELVISYKNTSTTWPGGNYKNYLRIILPKDTALSEISIQDIPQAIIDAITDFQIYEAKDFNPPVGLEVEKVTQDNKTIYGFFVNIPASEVVRVKVKYNLVDKIPLDSTSFSYNLKLFKQPGVDSIPYSFSLEFPNNFKIINGKTNYLKNIVKDENLIVNFASLGVQ